MARPGQRGGTVTAEENPSSTPTEAPDQSVVADGQALTTEATETAPDTTETAPEAPQTDPQPNTTESGEQGTAQPAPQQPAKAEKSDDLTTFKAAVSAVYDSLKDLPEGAVVSVSDELMAPVTTEYRALGTKGRAEARKSLNEDMRAYLQNREVPKAQAAVKMSDAVQQGGTAPKERKAPAEPVDPTEAFVQRAVTYDLAKRLAIQTVPQGVKDDWPTQAAKLREELQPQVEAYQTWLTARGNVAEGQEPPAKPEGISPVVEQAFKLAQGRAAGAGRKASGSTSTSAKATFDGPRRSVKTHVLQAFENEPVGAHLKVSDIQKFASREYGTDRPSSGAISSALNSKNLPDSLEAGHKDGHFGAYKRA